MQDEHTLVAALLQSQHTANMLPGNLPLLLDRPWTRGRLCSCEATQPRAMPLTGAMALSTIATTFTRSVSGPWWTTSSRCDLCETGCYKHCHIAVKFPAASMLGDKPSQAERLEAATSTPCAGVFHTSTPCTAPRPAETSSSTAHNSCCACALACKQ